MEITMMWWLSWIEGKNKEYVASFIGLYKNHGEVSGAEVTPLNVLNTSSKQDWM